MRRPPRLTLSDILFPSAALFLAPVWQRRPAGCRASRSRRGLGASGSWLPPSAPPSAPRWSRGRPLGRGLHEAVEAGVEHALLVLAVLEDGAQGVDRKSTRLNSSH